MSGTLWPEDFASLTKFKSVHCISLYHVVIYFQCFILVQIIVIKFISFTLVFLYLAGNPMSHTLEGMIPGSVALVSIKNKVVTTCS